MSNFLDQPPDAAADSLEQRLGSLADGEVRHLFINTMRRIARLEAQVANLETKAFDQDF